jgi:glycosyltransferase involved in cell wall biosynthesis
VKPGTLTPPAISVIIPAFQEEGRLPKLLSQLTPDLRDLHGVEVIVSDGGSADGTVAVARAGADVVVEHPEGRRQTIAEGRNRGADVARGRVLVFLNADVTLADPAALFEAVGTAFRDGRLAAASCRVMVDPAEETPFDRRFHTAFNGWRGGNARRCRRNSSGGWEVIMRRSRPPKTTTSSAAWRGRAASRSSRASRSTSRRADTARSVTPASSASGSSTRRR